MATVYKKRILDSLLERALSGIGAVVIEGPKGCGKTTTGLQLAKSKLMLAWIMHEAESATQNRPLNFELAAFFCAWKKAIQTSAIKNIK